MFSWLLDQVKRLCSAGSPSRSLSVSEWDDRLHGSLELVDTQFIELEDGTAIPLWTVSGVDWLADQTAQSRPAILVLFPYPLLPADNGGSVRTLVLLKALRKAGYFVWLVGVGLRPEHCKALTGYADAVIPFVEVSGDTEERIRESGHNTLRARYHPAFDEAVPKLVEHIGPEVVFASFAFSAYALSKVGKDVLKVVDTIDVQHRRAEIAKRHGGNLESRRCSREDEIEAMRDADVLISIQPAERIVFEKMFPTQTHIVCGHAVDRCERLSPDEDAREVLFVGNRYDPNTMGMQKFIADVWPQVIDRVPEASLEVVGTVCRDLPSDVPGVRLHGFVSDVRPFYRRAAVVVNPVAYGSGQKIKTIEALSFGKCLVMTRAAREGIPDGIPCVETNVESMANPVVKLLTEPAKRKKMESEALQFCEFHFDPEKVFASLFSTIAQRGEKTWPR